VHYEEFISTVHAHGAFETRARAVAAARATLQTLAEQVGGETATVLAAELPPELARYIRGRDSADGGGEHFSVDEFWSRVAERADLGRADAARVARAVLDQLAGALPPGRLAIVWAELPAELVAQIERRRQARARDPQYRPRLS
jgi:uncharacterized protein (DUF2267 family)